MRKKWVFYLAACIVCLYVSPCYRMETSAASKWKHAYAKMLKKSIREMKRTDNWYTDEYTPYFRMDDIDGDGTKEFIIKWEPNTIADNDQGKMPLCIKDYISGTDMGIYTYYNGDVKKIIEAMHGGGNFSITYDTKQHLIGNSWKASFLDEGMEYYRLSNGKLKLCRTLVTESGMDANGFPDPDNVIYLLDGKQISKEDYTRLMNSSFKSEKKIFYCATKRNIKKYLNETHAVS